MFLNLRALFIHNRTIASKSRYRDSTMLEALRTPGQHELFFLGEGELRAVSLPYDQTDFHDHDLQAISSFATMGDDLNAHIRDEVQSHLRDDLRSHLRSPSPGVIALRPMKTAHERERERGDTSPNSAFPSQLLEVGQQRHRSGVNVMVTQQWEEVEEE